MRAEIRKRAIKQAEADGRAFLDSELAVAKVVKQTHSGHWDEKVKSKIVAAAKEIKEEVPTALRKRGKTGRLSLEQRVEAAHMIFIRKERQADVAKHFRVTQPAISVLIRRLKKKLSFLSELLSNREEIRSQRSKIVEVLQQTVEQNEIIDSMAAVKEKIKKENQIEAKPETIR